MSQPILHPGEPLVFNGVLTKREYIALTVLQALIDKYTYTPHYATREAVEHADAMIAALAKGGAA